MVVTWTLHGYQSYVYHMVIICISHAYHKDITLTLFAFWVAYLPSSRVAACEHSRRYASGEDWVRYRAGRRSAHWSSWSVGGQRGRWGYLGNAAMAQNCPPDCKVSLEWDYQFFLACLGNIAISYGTTDIYEFHRYISRPVTSVLMGLSTNCSSKMNWTTYLVCL